MPPAAPQGRNTDKQPVRKAPGYDSRLICFEVLRLVENGRYLDEALRHAQSPPSHLSAGHQSSVAHANGRT